MDRWIIGWCGKSLSENGMLCVHVIGYKARIQALVQDLQAEAHDLQAVQELFTSFIKVSDFFGWNTKGTSGWRRGW